MSAAQRNLWTTSGPVDNPFVYQAVAAALPEFPEPLELPDPLAAGPVFFSDFSDFSAGLASDFDSALGGEDAEAAARLSVR